MKPVDRNAVDSVLKARHWPDRHFWSVVYIPIALWLVLGIFSPNPGLVFLATFSLVFIGPVLWQAGHFPLLAFLAFLQWLQAGVPVLNANISGIALGSVDGLVERETAAALSFVGIVFLVVGFKLGWRLTRTAKKKQDASVVVSTIELSNSKLKTLYVSSLLVGIACEAVIWSVPGFSQLLLPLIDLRLIVVVLLIWNSVTNKIDRGSTLLVIIFEIALGFTGFFSDFKMVLMIAILALCFAGSFVSVRHFFLPLGALLLVTMFLMVFWQAVKVDYRIFVSKGTGQQVVLVGVQERALFLSSKLQNLRAEDLSLGFETLVQRISYVEYFALSIRRVPNVVPYQDGRLWVEAIQHVLQPRLLFPNKSVVDDNKRVSEFASARVVGSGEGTSINIGYFGESYIDFGPVLMFMPILLTGIFIGFLNRLIVSYSPNALVGFAVSLVVLLPTYGGSNIKMVGGITTAFIVYAVILKLFGRRLWVYALSSK